MDEQERPASADEAPSEAADSHRVGDPARRAIGRIRSGMTAAREPISDRVGQAVEGVERSWNERPGARIRRVRRMATQPLPYLYELHPEARRARPVEVGLQTVDLEDIAGTAVGGDQRGGDFLPKKAFRGKNWVARWQRLRKAQDKLAVLPPIDVVKFDGRYWVVDGHNRTALALYGGQVAIDANVIELVPMGERRAEPIASLAPSVAAARGLRTAGSGRPASHALTKEDAVGTDEPDDGS